MAQFNAAAARQAGISDADILTQLQQRDPALEPWVQEASQNYQPSELVDYLAANRDFPDATPAPTHTPTNADYAIPASQTTPNAPTTGGSGIMNWLSHLAPVEFGKSVYKAATTGLSPQEQKAAYGQALGSLADVGGLATLPISGSEYLGAEALGGAGRILANAGIGGAASAGNALNQNASPSDTFKSAGLGSLFAGGTAGLFEGAGAATGALGNKLQQAGTTLAENALPEGLNITKPQQTSFFKKTGQQLIPWMKDNGLLSADPQVIKDAMTTAQGKFNALANDANTTVSGTNLAQKLQSAWEDIAKKTDPAYQAQAKEFADSANALVAKYGEGDIPVSALNDERMAQDELVRGNWNNPGSQNIHRDMRNILSQQVEDATKHIGNLDAIGKNISHLITFNETIGSKLGAGVVNTSKAGASKLIGRAVAGGALGLLTGKSPRAALEGAALGAAENAIEPYATKIAPAVLSGTGTALKAASHPGLRSLYELLATAGMNK